MQFSCSVLESHVQNRLHNKNVYLSRCITFVEKVTERTKKILTIWFGLKKILH